jgi:hypothetical protein
MQVPYDPSPRFGHPIGPWHWHFAWHPIRAYDQRLAWLRWVERRCIQKHAYLNGGGPDFWWQYRVERPTTQEPPRHEQ